MMETESIYFVRYDDGKIVGWSPIKQAFTDQEPTLKTDQEFLTFELNKKKEEKLLALSDKCKTLIK